MSHHQEIILQSLQRLSESTHSSSHQIHPLNSVTPPLPPTPTSLPAPLLSPPFHLQPFPSFSCFSCLLPSAILLFDPPPVFPLLISFIRSSSKCSSHSFLPLLLLLLLPLLLLTTVVDVHVVQPYLRGSILAVQLLRVEPGLSSLQPQLDPADIAAAFKHHAIQTP